MAHANLKGLISTVCLALNGCTDGYTSLGANVEKNGALAARPSPALSGLPWPSGTNATDLARLDEWETYRGRPNDIVVVLTEYTSWEGITHPDTRLDGFAAFDGTLVIAQPFWPVQSGGSLGACAAGDYDQNWRDFGVTLSAHDRQNSIVRLAWQFNGDYVEWSATDPSSWIACFRRVVAAIRQSAPGVLIDWSMNAHGTQVPAGGSAFDVYPGDDVVDVVGIDAFDMTPSSPDEAAFASQCDGPEGICSVANFAREHGKLLGVGQWAVVTCNGFGDPGGDNPLYIEKMHQVFADNSDIMAYESYYNDPNVGEFCTSLYDPVEAPLASTRYRELWGP